MLGRKSKPSVGNKVLVHKAILKPIWAYSVMRRDTTRYTRIHLIDIIRKIVN